MKRILCAFLFSILPGFCTLAAGPDSSSTLYLIPNTHGTIAGWLVDFDLERNYVLNNYLAHLDRVKADPEYRFALSEAPNLISLLEFAPGRLNELKQRLREKRVELCNGFFLEPTVNLSGGEALAQMGVTGLRWYEAVFGLRPRHCWMIDVVGLHRQMPQVVAGLGMETLFFCRNNPAKESAFWWVAPDGTRILALNNAKTYADFRDVFTTKDSLSAAALDEISKTIDQKKEYSPSRKVLLSLAGAEDYSLPPARSEYPSEFLRQWNQQNPNTSIRFSIPSDYVDALQAELKSGETKLQDYTGDTAHSYNAFWLNIPEVKQQYRRSEQMLQAAEMLATAASLRERSAYPAQPFYDSWVQLMINMDRNVLWGAGTGAAFKDPEHWSAWDRFSSIQKQTQSAISTSLSALAGKGKALALFNPLNWERSDPVVVRLPAGMRLAGASCQQLPGNPAEALCAPRLPASGVASFALEATPPDDVKEVPLEEGIETDDYVARIDTKTGELLSLKIKSYGRELLGGPANRVVAESVAEVVKQFAGDFMVPRPQRKVLSRSSDYPAQVKLLRGPVATILQTTSQFQGGSRLERLTTFYRGSPRIDFKTRLDLKATDLVVSVDFPLQGTVAERTRGIPFGFSSTDPARLSRPADYYLNSDHVTYGYSEAMLPAIRWSNYQLAEGSGLALLDQGLTSHELNDQTVTLGLLNAQSNYRKTPNELLRGLGIHEFNYAILPHAGSWQEAQVPRRAWEFNAPVYQNAGSRLEKPESFLSTSDNLIVEAIRRVGRQIEVRLSEWSGAAGTGEVTLHLPHNSARLTNLMGEQGVVLTGGPTYRFPLRPQQIVTLRFDSSSGVQEPAPILSWKSLVPDAKQKAFKVRLQGKGHPPRGY